MKIKVSVPATSANIGSGFDALGLAVTLYNTVTFEESDHLDISAADGTRIPRGETNLVYRSAKGLFDKVGKTINYCGLSASSITYKNRVVLFPSSENLDYFSYFVLPTYKFVNLTLLCQC